MPARGGPVRASRAELRPLFRGENAASRNDKPRIEPVSPIQARGFHFAHSHEGKPPDPGLS